MIYTINKLKDLRLYIASDLYRYMTSTSIKAYVRGWFISGFRYTFFMRCCKYFASKGLMFWPLYFVCRVALRHYSVKYGYQIPWQANIGPGLMIGHFGSVIVNPNSSIGSNCNLTTGVLFGLSPVTDDKGNLLRFEYPSVGNRVALSNNAKLIGGVKVGDDSIIGVNSVVTKDIPSGCVAVGSPAKVIANTGSAALVGSFHPWTLNL